jgi:sensor histidine kinase YesM
MADFLADMDKKRIAKHAIFWFVWISSFTMVQSFGYGVHDYFAWLFYYLITLPLFMAHTYFIAYWLVPKYFFYHRYFIFTVWIVVLLILASVAELMISNEFVWRLVKPENIQQGNFLDWQNVLINGIGNEYIIIVFLSVKVIRFWNSKVGEKAELINQKLSTEIELLQYQSYPRFVLNVMDRLENLAETNSSQTSEMIVKLSNLMSNMTTGRKSTKIVLQKEVGLIRSYIEIQQMSFPKGFHVNFLVTGELNGLEIPPFLFFQLVEEGFLVLDDFSEKTDFTVLIKTEPHYLLFSLTLWNDKTMKRAFNPVVLENCRKYLTYFYSENHKVMSSFEINFVEITIEIYL